MPQVYNKRNNPPKNAIYVGRGTPFGNPYIIGKDGTRKEVCEKFKTYVQNYPTLQKQIKEELKNKDLICHCHPKQCHADYLLKLANEL